MPQYAVTTGRRGSALQHLVEPDPSRFCEYLSELARPVKLHDCHFRRVLGHDELLEGDLQRAEDERKGKVLREQVELRFVPVRHGERTRARRSDCLRQREQPLPRQPGRVGSDIHVGGNARAGQVPLSQVGPWHARRQQTDVDLVR